MSEPRLTPIALFVYKRAMHTQKALESLSRCVSASESELFIFCDGTKEEGDAAGVQEVRRLVRQKQWCGKVNIIERETNTGVANSIIDGVTRLCNEYGRVIVLEDDLVVSSGFLRYMNEALERYQSEPQVMQISGYMFPVEVESDYTTFFLPFTTSWGWATWQRAWVYFDPSAANYKVLKKDRAMRKAFDLEGGYPYYKMLKSQLRGEIDSWAIRWYLCVFMRQGLVLYPPRTLIENIGFDGSGTHCGKHDIAQHGISGGEAEVRESKFPKQLEVAMFNYEGVVGFMKMSNPRGVVNKIKGMFR
jgi:hypothetical protein